MININLQCDKRGNILFKANVDETHKDNIIIKRCLFESKIVKSNKKFPYIIPMKFLLPILNNFNKDLIIFEKGGLNEFLEFADEYDENFYYIYKANSTYMNKWINEGCPKIYKVIINIEDLSVSKNVAFERLI